jgi:hypothetical protein
MEGCIQEITQKLPKTFINKKAPVRRLFEPEAFHTGNYKKLPNNVGVSFV